MKYRQFVTDVNFIYNENYSKDLPSFINIFSDDYCTGIDSIIFTAFFNNTPRCIERINKLRKKCFILGDSGGFQILTGVGEYSDEYREKTFQFLENTCDYSMLLDLPPYNIDFDYAMEQSRKNFEYFQVNKIGKTKFLNILHGKTIYHMRKWLDMMMKFDAFDGGWAVGGIKKTSVEINCFITIASLALMYKEGILQKIKENQLLHILGTCSPLIVMSSFYFLRRIPNFEGTFSFDSSSISQYTRLKFYILSLLNKVKLRWVDETRELCNCKVCQNDEIYKLIQDKEIYDYFRLYNHNYMTVKKEMDMLFSLSKQDKKVYYDLFPKMSFNIFDVIDELIANIENCEKILEHYGSMINIPSETVSVDDLF